MYIYIYSIYWYQPPNLVNSIHLLVLGTWSSLESPVDSSISTRLHPCAQCSVKYLLVNVNLKFCQKSHRKPNGQIIPSVLSPNTREFTTAQPHKPVSHSYCIPVYIVASQKKVRFPLLGNTIA